MISGSANIIGAAHHSMQHDSSVKHVTGKAVFIDDMPTTSELVAHGKTEKQVRKLIGADELIYQDLDALRMSAHAGNPKITSFEDSVFSGEYCAGKISKEFLENLEKNRSDFSRKL